MKFSSMGNKEVLRLLYIYKRKKNSYFYIFIFTDRNISREKHTSSTKVTSDI